MEEEEGGPEGRRPRREGPGRRDGGGILAGREGSASEEGGRDGRRLESVCCC